MKLNKKKCVKYFFFINKISKKIFIINDEILILDYIYKINRYKMLFIIVIEIIYLNIIFYIDMCFINNENLKNYE